MIPVIVQTMIKAGCRNFKVLPDRLPGIRDGRIKREACLIEIDEIDFSFFMFLLQILCLGT